MDYTIEPPIFDDRYEAGRELAERVEDQHDSGTLVIGLVRGGVPVAFPISLLLQCRLEVTVVRSIPAPSGSPMSLGAVAEDGNYVVNEPLVARLGLQFRDVPKLASPVSQQILQDLRLYRGHRPRPQCTGRRVILVDDGSAGDFDLLAATNFLVSFRPASLVVATPVISARLLQQVQRLATDVVALAIRHDHTSSAASFFRAWDDVTDDEILRLVRDASAWSP